MRGYEEGMADGREERFVYFLFCNNATPTPSLPSLTLINVPHPGPVHVLGTDSKVSLVISGGCTGHRMTSVGEMTQRLRRIKTSSNQTWHRTDITQGCPLTFVYTCSSVGRSTSLGNQLDNWTDR